MNDTWGQIHLPICPIFRFHKLDMTILNKEDHLRDHTKQMVTLVTLVNKLGNVIDLWCS